MERKELPIEDINSLVQYVLTNGTFMEIPSHLLVLDENVNNKELWYFILTDNIESSMNIINYNHSYCQYTYTPFLGNPESFENFLFKTIDDQDKLLRYNNHSSVPDKLLILRNYKV